MKLIIELPNGTVYSVKKKDRFTWGTLDELKEAIKKGKPLKAELEEIKAEADRQGYYNKHDRIMVEQILDNHINKADCDNDCEHCTWIECPKE